MRTSTIRALYGVVCVAAMLSGSSPCEGAEAVERMGAQLSAMLDRGEPVGRIEARWESLLGELEAGEAFLVIESFLRHGLEAQEPRLAALLAQLGEREAETRLRRLSRLLATEAPASKSRLIAIETGISELADHLRKIEKALGESESRSTLFLRRTEMEALGRMARDFRRIARRRLEVG